MKKWSVLSSCGHLLGSPMIVILDQTEMALAHGYVLFNYIKIEEYQH